MVDKFDLQEAYTELQRHITAEEHEGVLKITEKILKHAPQEKESGQCRIVALIQLSRYDECISFIKQHKLESAYPCEYAYALQERKDFKDSLDFLNSIGTKSDSIAICKAQTYYKLAEYKTCYEILKDLISGKSSTLENQDLLTNYLAAYLLANENSEEGEKSINFILKQVSTWEAYFNYCLILLNQGKFGDSIKVLLEMQSLRSDDEYNLLKEKNLNFSIIQTIFDGFDFHKCTNLQEEYSNLLKKNDHKAILPYFYNNYLHTKKEKDNLNETLKKLEAYSKTESLTNEERFVMNLNKVILLLRSNKFGEAAKEFRLIDSSKHTHDLRFILVNCYISAKSDKAEKLEDLVLGVYKDVPEVHLLVLQTMISNLTSKTIETFHIKLLEFVSRFFNFSCNYQFISFFINFYETRHLKSFLKEFIAKFEDVEKVKLQFKNSIKETAKPVYSLIGSTLYKCYSFKPACNYFEELLVIDEYSAVDKLWYINCAAHINYEESEKVRRAMDDIVIDRSEQYVSGLLADTLTKSKKDRVVKAQSTDKKKKKKKQRLPKNFDAKAPLPDPERWVPRMQRKKYKNATKNKKNYQGASSDNSTTQNTFKK